MTKYINDPGNEVPPYTIVPMPVAGFEDDYYWQATMVSLRGRMKRDWFTAHHYFCTPLAIGNQYGFALRSMRDVVLWWAGGEERVVIKYIDDDEYSHVQRVNTDFERGVVTFQNHFALRTPPEWSLMTIQPPNLYIPGIMAMTAVVESDNLRRDFTWNMRMTIPGMTVVIERGAILMGMIPVRRGEMEKWSMQSITGIFDEETIRSEQQDILRLATERDGPDQALPHGSGRRYARGEHAGGVPYRYSHQRGRLWREP